MSEVLNIYPQSGFQQKFLSSTADVVVGGGAAGAGKTRALLMEPLRNYKVKGYSATIFRRTYPEITNPGALWDESAKIYPFIGFDSVKSNLEWVFKDKSNREISKIVFRHLQYEDSLNDYQGAQLPFIGFDELTHFCLTPDHEVLTKNGWKFIGDVNANDLVASLNSDEIIEYKPVLDTYKFNYNGKLRSVNQKAGVSFRATPNHKAVVMIQNPNKLKKVKLFKGWKFKDVGTLKTCYIPRCGKFIGKEDEWYYFIKPNGRGHGVNSNSIDKVKMDVWLSYLGWYLSEGCAFTSNNRSKSPIISIRQTKMKNHEELCRLHNELGFRWKYREDGSYMIFSRQLFDIVKPFGNSHQKRIPDYVFELSSRQQKIFFDSFVRGDGNINKNGNVKIGLCNNELIDDLQRIVFNIGLVSTKSHRLVRGKFDSFYLGTSNHSAYNIIRPNQWFDEDYNGYVYCLNVQDNHNFYIRHNGRCCWTGNSREMFLYLLSRNRSTCGVPSIVRATCNPDADSWLSDFIDWYIGDDGYIRKDRDGVIRYFTIDKDLVVWGDSKGEVIEKAKYKFDLIPHGNKEDLVLSFTFIEGDIHENEILLKNDPSYLAKLLSGSEEDQLRLYKKNWRVKIEKDIIFNYTKFQDIFLNDFLTGGQMFLTADIATSGRDLFIIMIWDGKILVDLEMCQSNSGKEAIDMINEKRSYWKIPNSNVLFDADGVGGGLTGWISNCVEFHAIRRPIGKESYFNLKSQCYFELSYCVNQTNGKTSKDMYYIPPHIATRKFPFKEPHVYKDRSIKWILEHQMKAIRKDTVPDQKLRIIKKDEQKQLLGGISPDFLDVWMMREYFELITLNRLVSL